MGESASNSRVLLLCAVGCEGPPRFFRCAAMPRTMQASNLCAMSAEEFWALRMDLAFDQYQAEQRKGGFKVLDHDVQDGIVTRTTVCMCVCSQVMVRCVPAATPGELTAHALSTSPHPATGAYLRGESDPRKAAGHARRV